MIISDVHKFIFIHNPKCGGTSVRMALAEYDSAQGSFWRKTDNRLPRRDMAHMQMSYIRDYYPQVWQKVSDYFVFGFTREPLARFISGFNETHKELYRLLMHDQRELPLYKQKLESYAKRLLSTPRNCAPYSHTAPQHLMYFIGHKRYADVVLKIEDASRGALDPLGPYVPSVYTSLEEVFQRREPRNAKPFKFRLHELLSMTFIDDLRAYYEYDYKLFGYTPESVI